MAFGPWQILIIAMLILVLFGKGKISGLMGDLGKGIAEFRSGIRTSGADASERVTASVIKQPNKNTLTGK